MTGEELRAAALALPEAEEREAWGHPTFRIRDKIFVGMAEDESIADVKATLEDQAELVASDPETFSVAPYVGRHGWVSVQLARIDPSQMGELVVEAWRRTAPQRVVSAIDVAAAEGEDNT